MVVKPSPEEVDQKEWADGAGHVLPLLSHEIT